MQFLPSLRSRENHESLEPDLLPSLSPELNSEHLIQVEHSDGAALLPLHIDELLLLLLLKTKGAGKFFIERFPTAVFFVGWDVCQQYNTQQITLFG